MQADEYQKLQETNKKIYELALNEEQKKAALAKMMQEEMKFFKANLPHVEINETITDEKLNINLKSQVEKQFPGAELLEVTIEKVTPQNIFEKLTASDANGNEVSLKELIGNNPEAIQKLCNTFNEFSKHQLEQQFGEQNFEMSEDDNYIKLKRTPESIQDPDAEVNNIVARAQTYAAQNPKINLEKLGEDSEMDLQKIINP